MRSNESTARLKNILNWNETGIFKNCCQSKTLSNKENDSGFVNFLYSSLQYEHINKNYHMWETGYMIFLQRKSQFLVIQVHIYFLGDFSKIYKIYVLTKNNFKQT